VDEQLPQAREIRWRSQLGSFGFAVILLVLWPIFPGIALVGAHAAR
jgi:nitrate reductase NapE component